VRFDAVLREAGGRITGTIEEIDEAWGNGHLAATIDGVREGQAVRFAKFYDGGDEAFDTVHYDGTLDAEGNEITGSWTVPGEWAGSFIMMRETGAEATVAAERSAPVS